MRTCSTCGSKVELNDAFCPNCGTGVAPARNQVSPEPGASSANAGGFAQPATVTAGAGFEAATQSSVMAPPRPAQPPRPPAPPAASARAGETTEQRYLRQTRNATVFIAVIVGIVTVLVLIGVIWTATNIARLNSDLNNGTNLFNNSNCESQGGSNPNC
jgi:cobalamin biosynthesis Mg chelatase CobN